MSPGAAFTQKLHLIYLINDLLHYCVRKNADELKNSLESVVIPMFCNATISSNDEQKETLNKLLTLWSSKANFFDSCAIAKLQAPPSSLQEYQNTLLSQYAAVITPLTQVTKSKFDNYQQQHQAFAKHATNQIAMFEAEKQKLEQQSMNIQQPNMIPDLTQNPQQMIPPLMSTQNRNDMGLMQNIFNNQNFQTQRKPPQQQQQNFQIQPQQQIIQQQDVNQFQGFNLPPPNFSVPDLSRPPPGFKTPVENSPPPPEKIEPEPEPQPFFTYPAGLMVLLVGPERYSYHSLDPESLKIPVSGVPNEKLMAGIEAYYSPPSHERPRDTEGWEKLGLYEYFKMKNNARKQIEEAIIKGSRERSKSPSPIPESMIKPIKKQKKRVYRSESPEPRNSRSKSRSVTPETRPTISANRTSRNRKKSRSPSPTPYSRNFNRDSRHEKKRRSVTPPSMSGAVFRGEFLDESNKGHQMLKKLGWTSGGLGVGKNQGIAEPISGGEVRDRSDLYKGIGMNSTTDPYENFRKNRSNNFIVRMKTRGEERN